MTESVQNKLEWSSRFVFIMACVGGAVGLGNIWMFPYKAGTNGGGAFVLIYIAAVMLLALPVCIAELMIGRRGGGGPPNAIARVAIESGHTKHWRWMGVILAGVGAVFALSFYSVVGGWTVAFAAKTVTGQISGLEANQIINLFDELNGNPVELYTWFCVFIGMTVYISSRGLHKGLEQAVRLMMPALFVMLIMTVFYAAIIGDFAAALSFLFTPDFSDFKNEAPRDAGLSYNFPHWDGFDLHSMKKKGEGENEEEENKGDANEIDSKEDFNIRQMNFDILDTGIRELWNPEDNTYTANPYVTIYTTDDDQSRKKWNDNAFQVTLTFTLEFDALNISHSVENKNNNIDNGESSSTSSNNNNNVDESSSNLDFEYASGYRGHVRVADLTAVPPRAYYLGLDDCVYFDMTDTEKTGGDPQVKFTKDLDEYDEKCFTLKEKTERVYANVKRDSTMLEIGTGSSIVIEDYDRFAIGYDFPDEETAMKQTGNWHDRAVFSYWKSKEKKNDESYRWFSGLGFGNITKLVKLKAGQTQTHTARLVVRDATLSENIIKERDAKRSYEAVEREFSKREGYNMEGSELPQDFQ